MLNRDCIDEILRSNLAIEDAAKGKLSAELLADFRANLASLNVAENDRTKIMMYFIINFSEPYYLYSLVVSHTKNLTEQDKEFFARQYLSKYPLSGISLDKLIFLVKYMLDHFNSGSSAVFTTFMSNFKRNYSVNCLEHLINTFEQLIDKNNNYPCYKFFDLLQHYHSLKAAKNVNMSAVNAVISLIDSFDTLFYVTHALQLKLQIAMLREHSLPMNMADFVYDVNPELVAINCELDKVLIGFKHENRVRAQTLNAEASAAIEKHEVSNKITSTSTALMPVVTRPKNNKTMFDAFMAMAMNRSPHKQLPVMQPPRPARVSVFPVVEQQQLLPMPNSSAQSDIARLEPVSARGFVELPAVRNNQNVRQSISALFVKFPALKYLLIGAAIGAVIVASVFIGAASFGAVPAVVGAGAAVGAAFGITSSSVAGGVGLSLVCALIVAASSAVSVFVGKLNHLLRQAKQSVQGVTGASVAVRGSVVSIALGLGTDLRQHVASKPVSRAGHLVHNDSPALVGSMSSDSQAIIKPISLRAK